MAVNINRNTNSLNTSNIRSSRERKECLQNALQQTFILREVVNDTTVDNLDKAVNEVDNVINEIYQLTDIQEKVCSQQEVFIDSQMMTSSSKVLKTCTLSLTKRMCDYNHVSFAQKLMRQLQDRSDDLQTPNWLLLEMRIMKLFKRIPDYNTLLGALQPLEKKTIIRKKPEQKMIQQPAQIIVPDKLTSHRNIKEEDSVEQTVRKIRKLILSYCKETKKPLDLFQLIMHPYDFGKTIRNLLYVSFLVKDGLMKLNKDNRGKLVIQPCRKETNSSKKLQCNNKTSIQNIISLNMKQWRILKKVYEMGQPMINFDEDN